MSKTVVRFTPVSGYDLPGLELWLAQMAARGLRFFMTAGPFTVFERTEAQLVTIHLECAREKTDQEDEELSALYREAGWSYWGNFRKNFYIFAAPAETDSPAHTDSEVFNYAIRRFFRQKLLGGLGLAVVNFLLLMFYYPGSFRISQLRYFPVENLGSVLPFFFSLAGLVLADLAYLHGLGVLLRFSHHLKRDLPLTPVPGSRLSGTAVVLSTLLFGIVFVNFCTQTWDYTSPWIPLDKTRTITLQEIEGETFRLTPDEMLNMSQLSHSDTFMNAVYKLTPVEPFDLAAVESWLEDLAEQGLYLKRFRPLFSSFTRGAPRRIRYRVEYVPGLWPDDEVPGRLFDLYEEMGWDYVGPIGNERSLLIFRARTAHAPEPHTDPPVQGELLNKLARRLRRNFILVCVLLAIALGIPAFSVLDSGTLWLELVQESALFLVFLYGIVLLFSLPSEWKDWRRMAALSRSLRQGIPLTHKIPYKNRSRRNLLSFLFFVTLAVLLIFTQYILPFTGGPAQNLDKLKDFTLISIQSLEGEGYRSDSFVADGVDYANFCDRERYLLAPTAWETVQSGKWDNNLWVRLEVDWYCPLIPSMAQPLANDLLKDAMKLDGSVWWEPDTWWDQAQEEGWTVTEYSQDGADYLAVAQCSGTPFQVGVVAGNGRAVVARYTGHGTLAEHLEELVQMTAPIGG